MVSINTSMEDTNENKELSSSWRGSADFTLTNQIALTWPKPGNGEMAVNTDGSYREDKAGFGFILRDENGSIVGAMKGGSARISITFHELQGVKVSLKLGSKKGCTKIFRCDSKTSVSYITESDPSPPWTCHHIWESIKKNFVLTSKGLQQHILSIKSIELQTYWLTLLILVTSFKSILTPSKNT